MLKYTFPRTLTFSAAALAGGLLLTGCAAPADYDQGIAALSQSLEAHGYQKLGTDTDRDSVDVIVAVGDNCEGNFWMVSDTNVSNEEIDVDVVTNPNLGKKDVTSEELVYQNGNYPTNSELLRNPLIARACINATAATATPTSQVG